MKLLLDRHELLSHLRARNFTKCNSGWFYARSFVGAKVPALYSWINAVYSHDRECYLDSSVRILISCEGGTLSVEHELTGLKERFSVEKNPEECLEILTRCNLFSHTVGNVLQKAS